MAIVFANVCAVDFLSDFFWILGVGRGSQVERDFKAGGSAQHAFSDIRDQNEGFR